MKRDLKFEATYDHPIDSVWEALTDRETIAQWLMETDFEPRIGHRFQFRAKPVPGWDGIVNCEVLALEPPRFLSYSWRTNAIDTVLSITLTPVSQGTHLRLEHTGFTGMRPLFVSWIMGSGWKGIVSKHLPAAIAKMREKN